MEPLQLLGFMAIVALISAGLYVLLKYRKGPDSSVSDHIAHSRQSYLASLVFLCLLGSGFFSFYAWWLLPTYGLATPGLQLLVWLAWLCLLIVSIVPVSPRRRQHLVHFGFGAVLAICLGLLSFYNGINDQAGPAMAISGLLMAAYCAACIVLYATVPHIRRHFLNYEVGFIGLYMAHVLCAIFKV